VPYVIGRKPGAPHDMLAWRRLPLFSIRQGDWKLWESVNDKSGKYGEYKLLFNLKDDLNETTDLAARNPEKVKELEALARKWSTMLIDPKWEGRRPVHFDVCGTPFVLPL